MILTWEGYPVIELLVQMKRPLIFMLSSESFEKYISFVDSRWLLTKVLAAMHGYALMVVTTPSRNRNRIIGYFTYLTVFISTAPNLPSVSYFFCASSADKTLISHFIPESVKEEFKVAAVPLTTSRLTFPKKEKDP